MKKALWPVLLVTGGLLGAETVDLAGTWTLTCEGDASLTCPIAVPGGVHSALYAAGKIPDPYYGTNETNVQWVGLRDWKVSRTFDLDAAFLAKKEVVLRLEDCDTFCTLKVNGVEVGQTEDRFQRYTFDVKALLKPGQNAIEGFFASAQKAGDAKRQAYGRPYPMSNVPWAKNQALVRKPACHAGWDWGPAQMVTGFCGPVKLIATDGPRVEYVYADPKFTDDLKHCTLTVFAAVSCGTRQKTVFEIDDPPLWWPNGMGARRFYTYTIAAGGEKITRKIGLRKLEVLNEKTKSADGKDELSLVFRVNGRRLFAKGANWIPCDAFENRQTPARYRYLLASAADANMNMLRLWGGGQYEKDCFYEICDELGILVWHDMMCSCAVYPGDEAFLGEIRRELSHQLRRLRDYACIGLWCGDNECLGAIGWFDETRNDKAFYRGEWIKRSKMQADCVAKWDPNRTYWPSSPCCGPGDFGDAWKEDSRGDMHNWEVWHANKPFDEYYKYRPRFCSEFGYQSFPSPEVAETFASKEQIAGHGPDFEWHQKNSGGNRRIRETMARYFPAPKNVDGELLLSQFQQGMAIKMAVDGWRAQRPRCMGTLYWQLNDNWPVASWSSVEYGGKWKPLHHLARRFYAPVAVVARPAGEIVALNDTAETLKGEVRAEYWAFDGRILKTETFPVTLKPDSAVEAGRFAPEKDAFLVLTLTTPCGSVQNDWQFGFYKDAPLAAAKVSAEVAAGEKPGTFRVTLATDKPAFYVWANVRNVRGEFSDNCLTLLPGRPQALVFTPKDAQISLDVFKSRFSVTHLADVCGK